MHCRSVFIKQKSTDYNGHFCFALEKKGHIRVFCTVRLDIPADVKRNNTSWSSITPPRPSEISEKNWSM